MKKHFLKYLIPLLCVCLLIGCDDKDEIVEVQLDDITLNFGQAEKSEEITVPIKGLSNYWHVYSPSEAGWLTFETIPGTSKILVNTSDNDTGKERESYIMVRSEGQTQKINVRQDAYVKIALEKATLSLDFKKQAVPIEITNIDEFTDLTVEVDEADKEWLTVTLDGSTLSVLVTRNTTEDYRESVVKITGNQAMLGTERTAMLNIQQGIGFVPLTFDIPDFSESKVYKVMYKERQVAQITREYLRLVDHINAQAIVVYPVELDEVDLTKGYVAQIVLENKDLSDKTFIFEAPADAIHGGRVSFNAKDNKIASYTPGTLPEPVAKIYLEGSAIGADEIEASLDATVEMHVIEDTRKDETNIYPIVKIGAQYWMGKHLNTTYYNAKKEFEEIPTNQQLSGSDDATVVKRAAANCAVLGSHDAKDPAFADVRAEQGLLYSYLAIGGFETEQETGLYDGPEIGNYIEDNISPEGWIVPRNDVENNSLRDYIGSFTKLRGYLGADGQKLRADDNITGFDATVTGYRSWDKANFVSNTDCWLLSRDFRPSRPDGKQHPSRKTVFSVYFRMNSSPYTYSGGNSAGIRSINVDAIKIKE